MKMNSSGEYIITTTTSGKMAHLIEVQDAFSGDSRAKTLCGRKVFIWMKDDDDIWEKRRCSRCFSMADPEAKISAKTKGYRKPIRARTAEHEKKQKRLRLIKQSIFSWEKLSKADGEHHGASSCALCGTFIKNWGCAHCPVKEMTGKGGCQKTPYMEWWVHQLGKDHRRSKGETLQYRKNCPTCRELVARQITFLREIYKLEEESL